MAPVTLLLAGGAISLYCLWQLGRWLRETDQTTRETDPARLEALVDELVVTAETTVTMIQDRSEALSGVIAQADKRLAELSAAVAAPVAAPVEAVATEQEPAPDAPAVEAGRGTHAQVYQLADNGQDVTAIARQMGLTKGEVLLILGLRQTGRGL